MIPYGFTDTLPPDYDELVGRVFAGSFGVSFVIEKGVPWYLENVPWHFYDK